jgi:photosystem II stability/assembly factor-like uncharacterized protein
LSRLVHLLLIGIALAAAPGAARAECADPVPESEWSVIMPLASQSLMLDITRVGNDIVVVGDRGHVLVSADEGRSWAQNRTPTRTVLTGVWFHDRNLGWAVGHDAVILRTENGGDTWCRVHFAPELEFPLFDIWFADESNGFAVGAYGYFLRSSDGGLTWEEETLELVEATPAADNDVDGAADDMADDAAGDAGDDADEWADDEWADEGVAADLHMNRIISDTAGRLYLMAEAGTVFRSDDQGLTWQVLNPPYDGSFFGGLPLSDGSLLVFGLRGNMFRSWDGSETWRDVSLPVDTSLFGGAQRPDGGILVVGTAGVMLFSREGDRFRLEQRDDRKALMSALALDDGALIVIGEPGVERIEAETVGLE